MIVDLAFQLLQMTLVIAVAPLLTGIVRATKARLLRRRGPPLIQPYRDLIRLARKEAVVADSASWLFRFVPYLVFAATWVAAALVPTFATGLLFSWSADLIVLGSHGRRGWDRFLMGSVAESVAVHAHCSVEVIRPRSALQD